MGVGVGYGDSGVESQGRPRASRMSAICNSVRGAGLRQQQHHGVSHYASEQFQWKRKKRESPGRQHVVGDVQPSGQVRFGTGLTHKK